MAEETKEKNLQALKDNPELMEMLTEKVGAIVNQQFAERVGSDVMESLAKAKAKVGDEKATQRVEATIDSEDDDEPKQQATRPRSYWKQFDREQQAEIFVSCLAQSAGFQRQLDLGMFPGRQLQQQALLPLQRGTVPGMQQQALGPNTDSKGGYTIPDDFVAEIEKRAMEPAVIWPLITKRPTSRDVVTKAEITSYPTANVGANAKSSSTTSSDDITETEPTFDELTWVMRYIDARYLVKLDLIDDSPLNIMSELAEVVGDAFSVQRETLPLTGAGSGSSEPAGILENGSISTVAIDAALSVSNILTFMSNVPQRYRGNASLLMSAKSLFKVADVLSQNVNAPQFLQEMKALPSMYETAYVPNDKLVAGDLRRYVVYHNTLMRMVSAVVPRKFSVDTVIVEKWDGQVTQTDAFRIGTGVTYS